MSTPITTQQGYAHGEDVSIPEALSKKSKTVGMVTLVGIVLTLLNAALHVVPIPVLVIATVLSGFYWIHVKSKLTNEMNRIFIGPRYIVCGNTILYLATITSINIEQNVCILKNSTKTVLRIEHAKFTSVSKKAPKVKTNRSRKYNDIMRALLNNAPIENSNVHIQDNR